MTSATETKNGSQTVLEAGDHIEDSNDFGSINIHNNVFSIIARETALKVPGVVELSGSFVDGLAGMIGKKNMDRGIIVDVEENSVSIQLHVVLEFGVRIPEVGWQLQNEVRKAIQQMTGKTVTKVDIIVQGIRFPNEGGKPGEVYAV